METSRPGAAIFDLDGTLADTTSIVAGIHREILGRLGVEFGHTDYEPGVPTREFIAAVAARRGRGASNDELDAAESWFRQQHLERISRRPDALHPHAAALLGELRAANVRTALATSGFRAAALTRALGIHGLFDAIVDRDDVAAGKPAPDLFTESARRLGVPPERCCGIEDAPAGIHAIVAAGMCPIAVQTTTRVELLYRAGAFVTFSSLAYLDAATIHLWFRYWTDERKRRREMEIRALVEQTPSDNGVGGAPAATVAASLPSRLPGPYEPRRRKEVENG